uniref:Uncharacterized protein n=1 Tax=Octopus bimaculoides TaxID=37653 RepID=A0A0L8HYF8_OCTBM
MHFQLNIKRSALLKKATHCLIWEFNHNNILSTRSHVSTHAFPIYLVHKQTHIHNCARQTEITSQITVPSIDHTHQEFSLKRI